MLGVVRRGGFAGDEVVCGKLFYARPQVPFTCLDGDFVAFFVGFVFCESVNGWYFVEGRGVVC